MAVKERSLESIIKKTGVGIKAISKQHSAISGQRKQKTEDGVWSRLAVARAKIYFGRSSWNFLRINHSEAKERQFQLSEPEV